MTTQIESCACGGMTAVSTKWAKDALLFIQSFRDAHQKCRDVFIATERPAKEVDDEDFIAAAGRAAGANLPETVFVPQPACPSCGHENKGTLCRYPTGMPGGCGCVNRWHESIDLTP